MLEQFGYNLPGSEFVASALALDEQRRQEMNPTLRVGLIWCSLRRADLSNPIFGPDAEAARKVVEGILWDLAIPIVQTHLITDSGAFEKLGLPICSPPNRHQPDFAEAQRHWTVFVSGAVSAVEAWALSKSDVFGDAIKGISAPMESIPELFAWVEAKGQVWRAEELLETRATGLDVGRGMTR